MRTIDMISWNYYEDYGSALKQIKTEETRGWDQQKVNGVVAEIGRAVLVLAAVAVIWCPLVFLLWP